MINIALLTCSNLSGYHTDESFLYDELVNEKFNVKWCIWDEPHDWSVYDMAIIRTTWDYTKNRNKFLKVLQQIEQSGCVLHNNSQVVKWNSDKRYLFDLQDRGLPVLPVEAFSIENFDELFDKWKTDKLVCKPFVGATAEGIDIVQKGEKVPLRNTPSFVQPFIPSVHEGELSFHFFNNEFSHAVRKVPKAGDFRVQEEHGGATETYFAKDEEVNWTRQFLLEDYLYARVDLLPYQNQLCLIELELIEPALYFSKDPLSAQRFVKAIQMHILAK